MPERIIFIWTVETMRVARKREPRVVKEKSHKEEERLTPEHIITKEMCEFALEQMHEYDT